MGKWITMAKNHSIIDIFRLPIDLFRAVKSSKENKEERLERHREAVNNIINKDLTNHPYARYGKIIQDEKLRHLWDEDLYHFNDQEVKD